MTVAEYRFALFYNVNFVSTGIADLPARAPRPLNYIVVALDNKREIVVERKILFLIFGRRSGLV